MSRSVLVAVALALAAISRAEAADPVTAVITAYQPEWEAMRPLISAAKEEDAGGLHLVEGRVAGAPILLVESGIGPVNAAMSAQIAIDRFHVRRLVVAGVAGGVSPALHVGDVTVPERWSEYLFSVFARSAGPGYELPPFATNRTTHYEMIFPQPMAIGRAPDKSASLQWLEADADLLRIAKQVSQAIKLDRCQADHKCLSDEPRLIVGGNGVSGSAFVDNAGFRRFIDATYHANAVDMESAAVAHVASSNRIPFIALRSLSDLAGAEPDANGMATFQALAAKNAVTVLAAFLQRLHEADASR